MNQQEMLAILKVLACMAMADGQIHKAERNAVAGAIEQLQLPEEVALKSLLVESMQIDQLLGQLQSPLAKDIVYQSAYTLAHIDGEYHPQEQQLLEKIEQAFPGHRLWKGKTLFNRLLHEAGQAASTSQVEPTSDPAQREAAVESRIISWAAVNAVAGTFAIADAQIASDLLVYLNQLHLIQEIGTLWGHEDPQEITTLRQAILGGQEKTGIHIALNNLTRLLPRFDNDDGTAVNFVTTYAVGKAADRYFASDACLDEDQLQQAFEAAKKAGHGAYEANKAAIAAKRQDLEPRLRTINNELETHQISEDRYMAELLGLSML